MASLAGENQDTGRVQPPVSEDMASNQGSSRFDRFVCGNFLLPGRRRGGGLFRLFLARSFWGIIILGLAQIALLGSTLLVDLHSITKSAKESYYTYYFQIYR